MCDDEVYKKLITEQKMTTINNTLEQFGAVVKQRKKIESLDARKQIKRMEAAASDATAHPCSIQ